MAVQILREGQVKMSDKILSVEEIGNIRNGATVEPRIIFDSDVNALLDSHELLRARVEELEQEWISVDERLPDNQRSVLVLADYRHLGGIVYVDKDCVGVLKRDWCKTDMVTHWRELPQPPPLRPAKDTSASPLCECGHGLQWHFNMLGGRCTMVECDCQNFDPTQLIGPGVVDTAGGGE